MEALNFRQPAPHPNFRLWLSSDPTSQFPISLLQNSIKMTMEPARGLKTNMQHLYKNVISNPTDDLWSICKKPAVEPAYRRLLFSLSFFHSVLIERKKFANLGWNVRYDFNESDFRVCAKMIAHILDTNAGGAAVDMKDAAAAAAAAGGAVASTAAAAGGAAPAPAPAAATVFNADALPWDAIRYLVERANYGGRVTNVCDERLLAAYAVQYFCSDVIHNSVRYSLTPLNEVYFVPNDTDSRDIEVYRKYIASWPKADLEQAEIFGQHPNADIASQLTATKTLLSTMLNLQPRVSSAAGPILSTAASSGGATSSSVDVKVPSAGSGGGGIGGSSSGGNEKSREDIVLDTLGQLRQLVPPEIDLKAVRKIQEAKQEKTPLTIVLYQEIDRYNQLLRLLHSSMTDLHRATRGDILRSPELDAMFEAIFQSRVPEQWHCVYPSTKPLGAWVRDLSIRVSQLRKWGEDAQPKVFLLSGFTLPLSFLTALLQQSSRKNQQSFENLTFEFIVMTLTEQALNAQPKDGAYIKGLWLEGARWDVESGTLAEPLAMELFSPMPIIQFKPVEKDKKKSSSKGIYKCPLYLYPVRAGTVDRSSFLMDVDLKAGQRGDGLFWSKRGTALLLTRDDV